MDIFLGLVALAFVLLTSGMVGFLFKSGNAHSEKMAHEQDQLDRKNGAIDKNRAGAVDTMAPAMPPLPEKKGWFAKHWLSILIAIVGMVLMIWGFNIQTQPEDVGSLSRKYWLPLFVIWGVGAALIALNAETLKKSAGVLQWVLFGAVFMLFIGLPVIGWFGGSGEKTKVVAPISQQVVPLASLPESDWPKLVIPAGGKSEIISRPSGMGVKLKGYQFLDYSVYPDGTECSMQLSGSCPQGSYGVYVKNQTSRTNVVSYAFVPD